MIGCGHDHNEYWWSERLPFIYQFLLDVREEPNPLLGLSVSATGSVGQVTFPVYGGTAYSVERSAALTNGWSAITNWPRESKPWDERTVDLPTDSTGFFRVKGE